jgi:paraquat-inducible protein A
MMRWGHTMQPWSMNEVMILGILVALIKIAELATVEAGIGMYAMGGLVVLFPAIALAIDEHEIWQRIEWADGREPPEFGTRGASRGEAPR